RRASRDNGLGRCAYAIAAGLPLLHVLSADIDLELAPAFAPGIGDAGPLRLLNDGVAGQASWLLPLAIIGLAVAAGQILRPYPVETTREDGYDRRRRLVEV